ncbi:MAG TPA: hypothetical protein VF756_09945 [Thermoanaerobaculia bacterium]
MPELIEESTPPTPPTPSTIDPAAWEDFQGFRESFLAHFTRPEDNAALRRLGQFLYELILETAGTMPDPPESATRTETRAALADLRHLEGFLGAIGAEHKDASLSPDDARLSELAEVWSVDAGQLADRIEAELRGGES